MFTGLIEGVGEVRSRLPQGGGERIQVATMLDASLALGDGIAVTGVCLTVVSRTADGFSADLGPETLRVTTLGRLAEGAMVNLERPLKADGRFGGHIVQGHVDGIGEIAARRPDAGFEW